MDFGCPAERTAADKMKSNMNFFMIFSEVYQFLMPETGNQVIIHQPGGLHKGIAYRGTHKTKPMLLQIFAHGI
jgi:hypothetical protein